MSRLAFTVTVCVVLRRDERWLLTVRRSDAAYGAGRIGLVGGHLEMSDGSLGALETAARRESLEETGIDLTGALLTYLESAIINDGGPRPQLTVTFGAVCPLDVEPILGAPQELTQVGWWTLDELAKDPRCPPWLPALLRRSNG